MATRKKVSVEPGVVAKIPLTGGAALAVVLFVARDPDHRGDTLMAVLRDEPGEALSKQQLVDLTELLVWTGDTMIAKGDWPVTGRVQLPDVMPLTERRVGVSVYVGETRLRSASPEDRKALPSGRGGRGFVQNQIEEVRGKGELAKRTAAAVSATARLLESY